MGGGEWALVPVGSRGGSGVVPPPRMRAGASLHHTRAATLGAMPAHLILVGVVVYHRPGPAGVLVAAVGWRRRVGGGGSSHEPQTQPATQVPPDLGPQSQHEGSAAEGQSNLHPYKTNPCYSSPGQCQEGKQQEGTEPHAGSRTLLGEGASDRTPQRPA